MNAQKTFDWTRAVIAAAVFIMITGMFGHVAKGAQNPGLADVSLSNEEIRAFIDEVEQTISSATQSGDQAVASFWRDRITDDADLWVSLTAVQDGGLFATGHLHLDRAQAMQLLPMAMKGFEKATEDYEIDIEMGNVSMLPGNQAALVDTRIEERFTIPSPDPEQSGKQVSSSTECEHLILKEGPGMLRFGDANCSVSRDFSAEVVAEQPE
ncbi:MAG: hypothetical protein EOM26_09510 [Alphaproteobacteria bacterium]|nr:hypothetical protein [Alphaproteobacteria bacterium]